MNLISGQWTPLTPDTLKNLKLPPLQPYMNRKLIFQGLKPLLRRRGPGEGSTEAEELRLVAAAKEEIRSCLINVTVSPGSLFFYYIYYYTMKIGQNFSGSL